MDTVWAFQMPPNFNILLIIASSLGSLLYTAQLKTCCINRHVVPFFEIQAALEDTPSFQPKTHAQL